MNKMKLLTRLLRDPACFGQSLLILRHIIGESGVLLILDAKEGGVVYRELIPEYLDDVRTVSEGKQPWHSVGTRLGSSTHRFSVGLN